MTMDDRVTPMEGSAPSLVGLGIALCAALHAGPAVAGDSCVMIQFDVTRRCPADCGAPVNVPRTPAESLRVDRPDRLRPPLMVLNA